MIRRFKWWSIGFFPTAAVVVAILLYSVLLLIWKPVLLVAAIIVLFRIMKWHSNRNRPVPWDKDYDGRYDRDLPSDY